MFSLLRTTDDDWDLLHPTKRSIDVRIGHRLLDKIDRISWLRDPDDLLTGTLGPIP